MSAASIAAELDDALEPPSIVESEIPEVRDEARAWLVANNKDDQKTIAGFAVVLVIFAAVIKTPWALVLAGCIALVLPFRWAADPHFRDGDMRRGILWTNLGTWYLGEKAEVRWGNAIRFAAANNNPRACSETAPGSRWSRTRSRRRSARPSSTSSTVRGSRQRAS